jgi:hypothetical protein
MKADDPDDHQPVAGLRAEQKCSFIPLHPNTVGTSW